MDYNKKALAIHKKQRGKIEIKSKVPLKTKADLAIAYTPGVAEVSRVIGKDIKKGWQLTNRANTVAIVTDGSAVLGLGNIGPEAGMPVMEGKSAIFKEFAGVDAYPLAINSQSVDEIVRFCELLEPSVGGINLEDISAPRCFDVLARLEKSLSIPVFHDDQDGTAIVVLAALINAAKATKKKIEKLSIVINGAGAAGIAITRLLLAYGARDVILLDSRGTIYHDRPGLNKYKKCLASQTNQRKIKGDLAKALAGADVFIGVSKANLVSSQMVESMKQDPIIFAMANPKPEIEPKAAYQAGAAIVGTGRSDLPNQINNALVFPGLFRGLLGAKKKKVTLKMKLAAAQALARVVKNPAKNKIIPQVTDKKAVQAVARAVKNTK